MSETQAMGGKQEAPASPVPGSSYLSALRAEARILIRAIVGDPDKNISALQVQWRENDVDVTLDYPRVAALIAEPNPGDEASVLKRIGQLQAVRDGLIRITRPATGYSIAYTGLVVGNERGKGSEATYELAKQAYGGLTHAATMHRWFIRALTLAALLIAIFASWEATKASLGRSLLQTLEPLRAQQTKLADEKKQIEADIAPPGDADAILVHPICELYESVLRGTTPDATVSTSVLPSKAAARIRDVCGRDKILSENFKIAHDGLRLYLADWPDMVGSVYAPVGHLTKATGRMAEAVDGVAPARATGLAGHQDQEPARAVSDNPAETDDDVEFRVAPVVQVITGYMLPFTFGIIGSLLYVLLQHYTSVRANLLEPRDHALAYLRVVLGIVVAASVSLLITSNSGPSTPATLAASGSTSPNALVGSLTFSSSLITFLAGFGAEAVFTMLQNLVHRVFALEKI